MADQATYVPGDRVLIGPTQRKGVVVAVKRSHDASPDLYEVAVDAGLDVGRHSYPAHVLAPNGRERVPTTCDDCAAEGTSCAAWCALNRHHIPGDRAGDTCHCGRFGWVRGETWDAREARRPRPTLTVTPPPENTPQ